MHFGLSMIESLTKGRFLQAAMVKKIAYSGKKISREREFMVSCNFFETILKNN